MRPTAVVPGLVLVAGGVVTYFDGRANRHIEDAVALIGLSLVIAWVASRPRPAGRFLASGLILTGVGGSLVLNRVLDRGDYRDPFLFIGIALGFALLEELETGQVRRAAGALVGIALTEALLIYAPVHVNAPDIWAALDDGWGFGIMLVIYGLVVLAGVTLPGRAPGSARRR